MSEKGALNGIRVLDLTRVLAGPYCCMMMADMGAEVIKIEIPKKGDDSRYFGPFINGESRYYANLNRNKKGITLNLKSQKGKEIFINMVKDADVVVENYRPGVMDKLGLGYDVLSKVNPQIVYAAASGFGSYGPDSKKPGYDIIAQATSGIMSITGWDERPTRVGNAIGDILGGLSLAIGVMAALLGRNVIGKGQKVDISLVDSCVSSLEIMAQRYFATGKNPEKIGNRYAAAYPYDSFTTKDGSFVIGCGNDKLYSALCILIGHEELVTDPRFITNNKRLENYKELSPFIEAWASKETVQSAIEKMDSVGIPCAPINTLEMVTKDPHIASAREMFVECEHPVMGKIKLNGCHIKLLETKPSIRTPAPLLGQHNAEVYKQLLGYDDIELKELEDNGVI